MDCQENREHLKAGAKIDRVVGLRNGNADTARGVAVAEHVVFSTIWGISDRAPHSLIDCPPWFVTPEEINLEEINLEETSLSGQRDHRQHKEAS